MDTSELLNLINSVSLIFILVIFAMLIGFLILYIVSMWKLFKKAGKQGWESIIPYYSTYVLVEIAGLNWWYFLIAISGNILSVIGLTSINWIATLAGYMVNFFIFWNLAKKMHKSPVSTAILGTLFSGIMIPIMGLSKDYQYDSGVEVSPNGPLGEESNKSNNPEKFCLGCGQKLKQNALFCENCGKKVK